MSKGKPTASKGLSIKLLAGNNKLFKNKFLKVAFYVYILRLCNGQFCVDSTDDLARRFAEHQTGSGGRKTALLSPVDLACSEPQPDRSLAVQSERQIKRWSGAKTDCLLILAIMR